MRSWSQPGAESLAITGRSNNADYKMSQNTREFRRVGEPTRIFQFEKNQKGLKLWVVSREKATEVWRESWDIKKLAGRYSDLSGAHLWPHISGG